MNWFKHHCDLLDKPEMQIILDKHGTRATDAYMRLMEYATRHFDIDRNFGIYVESQRNFFTKIFPTSCRKTGKKICETFQNFGLAEFEWRGKEVVIKMKKIIELADEYTLRILKEREKNEK